MACTNAMARPATVPTHHRQLTELAFAASSSSLLKLSASPVHRLNGKLIIALEMFQYIPDAKFYQVEAVLRLCLGWVFEELLFRMFGVLVLREALPKGRLALNFSEDRFLAEVKMEMVLSKQHVSYQSY
ncbi:hypothetical protein NL676_022275 [Syzygium grande]|nr:hypothetical protein NL676_022275 [Syzygium grande]